MEAVSIRPLTILSPLQATDRPGVFQESVLHLVETGLLPADQKEDVLNLLEARELKLSTAIGNSIALPHAAVPKLPASITALAFSPVGIAADAPDGLPVRLFYFLLIPAEDYALHLRTVAAVTRFFRTASIFEKLRAASDPTALLDLFPS